MFGLVREMYRDHRDQVLNFTLTGRVWFLCAILLIGKFLKQKYVVIITAAPSHGVLTTVNLCSENSVCL